MDDVDAVQAQISRNMLDSGDWVSARLDGVAYLEKAPLVYWTMASSYMVFGVHDWAARIPIALAAILLCLLTAWFGTWAFGRRAGFYAGLCLATCVGLYLFTRILIPDVMLTGAIAMALWAFLRALEEDEPHPRLWAFVMAASMGVGLLLKSLIAVVFPCGAALVYLLVTRQLLLKRTWKRLHPWSGAAVILLIAAPWHLLATLRNPPYFAFTLHSGPGEYHGFLWFYFINEQLLRFLNMRYPRDYNTVPRLWFWLLNLVWLFPWSVYLPAATRLSYKPTDRAGRVRLLALCWAGFILVFFTFSTTQEYYSMPSYPAFALLLGSAMALDGRNVWLRYGTKFLAVLTGLCAVAATAILCSGSKRSDARRHFIRPDQPPCRLYPCAGPSGGPDDPVIRLFAHATDSGSGGLPAGRNWSMVPENQAGLPCHRRDDGALHPRSKNSEGRFRSLHVLSSDCCSA